MLDHQCRFARDTKNWGCLKKHTHCGVRGGPRSGHLLLFSICRSLPYISGGTQRKRQPNFNTLTPDIFPPIMHSAKPMLSVNTEKFDLQQTRFNSSQKISYSALANGDTQCNKILQIHYKGTATYTINYDFLVCWLKTFSNVTLCHANEVL